MTLTCAPLVLAQQPDRSNRVKLGGAGASRVRRDDTIAIPSPPSDLPQQELRLSDVSAGEDRSAATTLARPSLPSGLSERVRSVSAGWARSGASARAAELVSWLLGWGGGGVGYAPLEGRSLRDRQTPTDLERSTVVRWGCVSKDSVSIAVAQGFGSNVA